MSLQDWLPPLFTFFGTLAVVIFGVWYSAKLLDARIVGVDARIAALATKFEALETKFDALEQRVNIKIAALEEIVTAKIETLRTEMKQGFTEVRLEFRTAHMDLANRVQKLEEQRLVRP